MADQDRSGSIEAICLFFIVLSILVTLLRLISRILSTAGLWWDDYLSLAALIFVNVLNVLGYAQSRHGLGQHIKSTDPGGSRFFLHSFYFGSLAFNIGLLFAKISVLCFYQRVFATTEKTKQLLWITAGLTIAWFLSTTLVVIFQCSPVEAAWDTSIKSTCIDRWGFYLGCAIASIILDLILLFIPIPFLWRLHMGVPQKIALTVTFLLGYLNPVISIIRLAYVVELAPKIEDPDATWNFANFAIWSFVEGSVALISASVPSLHFLFLRIISALNRLAIPRTKSSSQNTDTNTIQGLAHQRGSFARLKDERANLEFARAQNSYEVSAYKKYGVMGEEMELESQKPAAAETAQILVSKSVDVVSRAGSEEPKVGAGYM